MRFVAFLDILGFKELVANNDLAELENIYRDVLQKTYALSFGVFQKAEFQSEVPDATIKSMIVSDSIIIWSEKDNPASFFSLSLTVQCMLYISLKLGVPLRGAIVRGELSEMNVNIPVEFALSSPVILGSGLTDAYKLEGTQNWSGCIVADECMLHALNSSAVSDPFFPLNLAANGLFTSYDVPVKEGGTKQHFCINWPMTTHEGEIDPDFIKEAFAKHNKGLNKDVKEKVKNTIAFNSFCWDIPNRGYVFQSNLAPR